VADTSVIPATPVATTGEVPAVGTELKTEVSADAAKPAAGGAAKKPVVIDPDEVIQVEAPIKEEAVKPANPKAAAWASLCQALFGSAEFRYVK
jgi:CO/xanthine dehydrogenase FAD-binding subunit